MGYGWYNIPDIVCETREHLRERDQVNKEQGQGGSCLRHLSSGCRGKFPYFTVKVLPSGQTDGVLAHKDGWTFGNQDGMSK